MKPTELYFTPGHIENEFDLSDGFFAVTDTEWFDGNRPALAAGRPGSDRKSRRSVQLPDPTIDLVELQPAPRGQCHWIDSKSLEPAIGCPTAGMNWVR